MPSHVRLVPAALAVALTATALTGTALTATALTGAGTAAATATTLGAAAAAGGRTFGAFVDSRRLPTDAQYRTIVDREFTAQTSEPELNWEQTQPTRGTFDFRLVDPMLASLNGRKLRGHGLVLPGRLPAWTQFLNTPDFARTELLNHITTVVSRLRDRVSTWDVVNEAFADDGTRRRLSFQTQLGDGWIAEAFRAARAADPAARLCYTDYGIEDAGTAKATAVYELVRGLKADGVPIDCVGFESHFAATRPVPAGFAANLQRFADLGVDVELTELDVVGADAAQYAAAVNACLAVTRCRGITLSTVRDRDTFSLSYTPALWDVDGVVKSAYAAVLAALDAATPTTTTTPITTTTTTTLTSLHRAALRTGRTFGASFLASRVASDPAYATLVGREFGVLTPEQELLWWKTEPQRGTFDFTAADQAVGAAAGRKLRGHVLVWSDQLPVWVTNLAGAADVRAAMTTHITTVAQRLSPRVSEWEVVSEAFQDNGTRRPNPFQNALGDGYVEEAFRAARAADPSGRLCYNDYNIEDPDSVKTQAVLAMVRDLKSRGVPLQCVTFGSHFDAQHPVPAGFATTLQRFAALGVDVGLSELDVAGSGTAQATAYAAAVNACLAVSRCTEIVVNAVRDKDTWRSSTTPTLFFDDGTPKPAYFAVLDALNAAAEATTTTRPTTTTTTTTRPTTTTTRPTTTTTTCRRLPWWPHCR